MATYFKKPISIEAFQTKVDMTIHTLEGDMKANVGDYIITGVQGEQYPCKKEIFEKTYVPVNLSSKITLDNLHVAIAALRKCAKENENQMHFTGDERVSDLCKDVADFLESLQAD